ncbi:hypothetical protein [Candidatus Poriferisocius sp.]
MGPERENAVFDILKMMAGMLTNLGERGWNRWRSAARNRQTDDP